MHRNIIAIGGGDVLAGETDRLDRELLRLSGTARPRLLFVPTASMDSEVYVEYVTTAYGRLGAEVSALRLWSESATAEMAAAAIQSADVIYVGGGNTKALMQRWRELGVDRALSDFLASGRPVGGVSAGAICWFRVGNSDWPQYEQIPGVNTARLEALGIVDLVLCPHTRDEGFRLGEFREMMRNEIGFGVGLDDQCAIQIADDQYRILASGPNAVAHLIGWRDGILVEKTMFPHDDYRALDALRAGHIE